MTNITTTLVQPIAASAVITAARSLAGTRWQHQGRDALGIDCCGFIVEVVILTGAVADTNFERDYRRQENGERMLELLEQYLIQVDERFPEDYNPEIHSSVARDPYTWRWSLAVPGDILALHDPQHKYTDKPCHLMIMTQKVPYWKGIHASEHGVVDHRLDIQFKRRIHSVWRIPGLVADA